jgi:serine/threonine-protein kinase HipA
MPGFLDDCLPDDWGKAVIARRLGRSFVDTPTILNNLLPNLIGALAITPIDAAPPVFSDGLSIDELEGLDSFSNTAQEIALILRGGSGIGGARPKLMIYERENRWIYKFSKPSDSLDICGLEYASMKLAAAAGINAPDVEIGFLGKRKYLKVRRFDVSKKGRYPLITLNSLLKSELSQDRQFPSYEDIAGIINKYCVNPKKNLQQLYAQMLINGQLNNTDDHLRNFSLINKGNGWELSPAYDIVPSEIMGAYHQLTFNRSGSLPDLSATNEAFGLSESECVAISTKISDTLPLWPSLLSEGGVPDNQITRVGSVFHDAKGLGF